MSRGLHHFVVGIVFGVLALAHALVGHWTLAIAYASIAVLSGELWDLKRGTR